MFDQLIEAEFSGSRELLSFVGGQQTDELIARPAKDAETVEFCRRAGQRLGDREQQAIAGIVTEIVVDALERIDVKEHNNESFGERSGKSGFERTAVADLGQRVSVGCNERVLSAFGQLR